MTVKKPRVAAVARACLCSNVDGASRLVGEFLIDGMLSGTGVRDVLNGGYVEPSDLGLSTRLIARLSAWQKQYEETHFSGFPESQVAALDVEGLDLTQAVREERRDLKIGYFSHGLTKRLD